MKKWKVGLTRYPEDFWVEAETKEEAIEKAKDKVDWSVWESECEEWVD